MRLDQWLWAVRVFKTRSIAADAIRGGHVKIDADLVKPARDARPGDVLTIRVNQMTRTLRVLGSPPSRIAGKLVAQYAEDLTPPEEYARREDANQRMAAQRPKGWGRPTKLDRREMERLEDGGAEDGDG
jgi:ribosome-associated heat shock protein Hsp15